MKNYKTGEDWETDMIDRALADHQRRDCRNGETTEMGDLVAIPLQRGGHKGGRVVYVPFRQLVHGPEIDLRSMMGRTRKIHA
jgi:hypothetical protein